MIKRTLLPILLVTLLGACGKGEAPKPAASAAPAAAPAATAVAPATDLAQGEGVFKKTCFMCHATGVAGAPKIGDKADWGPRIAKGKDTLYQHAINGFTGSKGTMPPKGGNPALSDADMKAGVDYMVSKAQ